MDFWHSLTGSVTVEVVTADPTATLTHLHSREIPLRNVSVPDELTLQITVQRPYMNAVLSIVEKRGEKSRILAHHGLFWTLRSMLSRPVLIGGLVILILLTTLLPTRMLFFCVEGNDHIPTRQILEIASQCGIRFGSARREVRSERVKNALLRAIPDLEWVGINTAGCVATISVRERNRVDETSEHKGVSSIVAACDGIIREITVTSGSTAFKVGQAVKAGQVLISGYTDCGLSIRAERAKGEILAETNRTLSLVMPQNDAQRGDLIRQSRKYSLIIGKKRINFYQDSGNLDTSCVKMYEENYVTLPGGFQLPITIVTEICISYDQTAATEYDDTVLPSYAERYLRSHMVAGQILTKEETITQEDSVICLDGNYGCLEMIGREQSEEIILP